MRIYIYDKDTKEFLRYEEAFKDPLESKKQGKDIYILPPNSTFIEPTFPYGMATLWDGDKWKHIEDNRGKQYWLPEDNYQSPPRVMEKLGALPDGAMLEAPAKTVEEARTEKLDEFKRERDAIEVMPIEYGYHFFDFDEASRNRLNDAYTSLIKYGIPSRLWTTADDEDVEISAEDIAGIIANASDRSDSVHKQYRALKEKISSMNNVEDIEAVTWA